MITVIADDLTGAAEIAGIGMRHGLTAALVPDASTLATVPDAPLVVINTDTRGLPAADAAARVARLAQTLGDRRLFKKIDSVLRGPVRAEIEAVLDVSPRYRRAIVVPQNPSRGRTIDDDFIYRIDGVPLDQTAFARDPDHPATTADASALLGEGERIALGVGAVSPHASALDDATLPVGGADLFAALLAHLSGEPDRSATAPEPSAAQLIPPEPRADSSKQHISNRTLFVCGSADTQTRATLIERVPSAVQLPSAWFAGDLPSANAVRDWASQFHARQVAALLAPAERCEPTRVHSLLCDAAASLIDPPITLYVDGGATAMALCRRMGWNAMNVVAELAPGAVTLAPAAGIRLTIKPGSYAWPWERMQISQR